MREGRLSRADELVHAFLMPSEWVAYLRVAETADGGDTVVALTSHRLLVANLRRGGDLREWRSTLWRDVSEVRLDDAEEEGGRRRATLTLQAGTAAGGAPVRIPDLDPTHARSLFQQAETLRLGASALAAPFLPLAYAAAGPPPPTPFGLGEAREPEPVPDYECTDCGEPVLEEHHFCPTCGSPTQEACKSCGHEVQTDFTVCPYCAAPLVPSALDGGAGALPEGTWVDFRDE